MSLGSFHSECSIFFTVIIDHLMDNLLRTHPIMANFNKILLCSAYVSTLFASNFVRFKMFKISIYSMFATKGLDYQVFVSAMFSEGPGQTAPSGQFSLLFLSTIFFYCLHMYFVSVHSFIG